MTTPPEDITVECPKCRHRYQDWYRASLNLDIEDFSDNYIRRASTATCPECGTVVELGTLVVADGIWRVA